MSTTPISFPKNNNLEWLRLIFATQVLLVHVSYWFGLSIPAFIGHFPGVPAFFFVSGFLIYASYLNAPGRRYLENRFLRLYPALILVTFGGGAVVCIAHGWNDFLDNIGTYGIWFLAQTTIGQAYNPGHFRDVGLGVINGALWTITVEILFYLFVPIIVWLEARFRFTVIVLIALSFFIYAVGPTYLSLVVYREKTIFNVISLTPMVWGWMFGFGILAVKHFDYLQRKLRYMPIALVPMIAMIWLGDGVLFGSSGNWLGFAYFLCYVGLVLWLAFVVPFVPLGLDLSYGVYIWHSPVLNLLLVLAIPNAGIAVLLTFLLALISWFAVEKPALKLKRRSLKAM